MFNFTTSCPRHLRMHTSSFWLLAGVAFLSASPAACLSPWATLCLAMEHSRRAT